MMNLTVVIISRNEESMIEGCLSSLKELGERVVVIDDCSTDRTVELARKFGAEVFVNRKEGFDKQRNFALSKVGTDWILYLDADERLTPILREEISSTIQGKSEIKAAYFIKRRNFYLGREWKVMDRVERLFLREKLSGWKGEVHESPIVNGEIGEMFNPLIHLTHRDISTMLRKTLEWSEIEARLRLEANHPKVSWWRLLRVMFSEFWRVGISEKGIFNGTEGWIETIYQSFSIFITYARLWEMQKEKSLEETYKDIERNT